MAVSDETLPKAPGEPEHRGDAGLLDAASPDAVSPDHGSRGTGSPSIGFADSPSGEGDETNPFHMRRVLTRRRMLARLIGGVATISGLTGAAWWSLVSSAEPDTACLRPPGALDEEAFLTTCIRCGRCADACPNRCITAFTPSSGRPFSATPGRRQYATPVIFPRRQACMLCNGVDSDHLLCTEACPTGALKLTARDIPTVRAEVEMGVAEVDTNLCYSFNGASCGACVRACPLEGRALRAGLWEKPLVDADECVGCGLCERSCVRYPQAIRVRPANADGVTV